MKVKSTPIKFLGGGGAAWAGEAGGRGDACCPATAAQAKHPAGPSAPPPATEGVGDTQPPLKLRRRRTDTFPDGCSGSTSPGFAPGHVSVGRFSNVGLVAVKKKQASFFLLS